MILPFNTNVNNNFYTFNFLKLKPFSKWIVCRAKTRKEWEISEEDCEAPRRQGFSRTSSVQGSTRKTLLFTIQRRDQEKPTISEGSLEERSRSASPTGQHFNATLGFENYPTTV
jgi:hypothetical protein